MNNKRVEEICVRAVLEILDLEEFSLTEENGKFALEDLQGGNLGNIESERFDNLAQIMNRLEAYHNDYIWESIWERVSEGEEISIDTDYDFMWARFLISPKVEEILLKITPEKLDKILKEKYTKLNFKYDYEEIVEGTKLLNEFADTPTTIKEMAKILN